MARFKFVNAVTDWGAVPDGDTGSPTDNWAILQPRLEACSPNTRVHVPAGSYKFKRPLSHGVDDVWVSGDGPATQLSVWNQNGELFPVLLPGLRAVEGRDVPTGVVRADRPDLYGVMDATWAPAPNQRYGFRTNGRGVCQAYAGPANVGALSAVSIAQGGRLYDYWSEAPGLCVRVALFLTAGSLAEMRANGNGAPVLGLGDVANPGPWCLGVDSSNPTHLFFCMKTGDQSLDLSTPYRWFTVAAPTSGGVSVPGGTLHHLEVWVNFDAGTYGARVNGATAAVTNTNNMAGLAGKRLAKNTGYRFTVGPTQNPIQFNYAWGTVPDFGVYAFNVLRSPALAAANTDASRYGVAADTVVCTDVTTTPALSLDRTIFLRCGSCCPVDGTAMRLYATTVPDLGFVVNPRVSDLAIVGGLGVGAVANLVVSGVHAEDGFVGLEHQHNGTSFPWSLTDNLFAGHDAAIDAGLVILHAKNTHVGGMGDTAVRLRGCSADLDGMFVGGFSNGGRSVFRFLDGPTNGLYSLKGVELDEEGYTFLDAETGGDGPGVVVLDVHRSSPVTTLHVNGLHQDSAGSTTPVILLRGPKGSSGGGTFDISCVQVGPNNGALMKIAGPGWVGQVDRRSLLVGTVVGATADVAGVSYVGEGGGAPGAPGSTWRFGATPPADSLGVDGDFYLNTATGDVSSRAAGVYTVRANLKGPAGSGGGGGTLIRTEL